MPKLIFTLPDRSEIKYGLFMDRERTTLGRSPDNKIVLEDKSVSSHHARIDRVKGGFEMIDMDSTNGIKENGVIRSEIFLKPGVNYKIGDIVMQVMFTPAETVEFAQETSEDIC